MRKFVKATGPLKDVPFNQAVRHGNLIFVSGQLGLLEDGTMAEGGVGPETDAALSAIAKHLEEVGASMSDVIKTLVFLVDTADYADYNEVYKQYFPKDFPARASVFVSELALGGRVEIEAVAVVDE